MFKDHNKTYTLDAKAADASLQNILNSCNKAQNTIPFDKILLRKKVTTHSYNLLIALVCCLLVFTLLLPIFIRPAAFYSSLFLDKESSKLTNYYINNQELYLCFDASEETMQTITISTKSGAPIEIYEINTSQKWIRCEYLPQESLIITISPNDKKPVRFVMTPTVNE